jgi:hypothetical protein
MTGPAIATVAYLAGFNNAGTDTDKPSNKIATAVALAESSGDTSARNPSGARGLWQIMPATAAMVKADYSRLDDPQYNARTAHAVWKAQGWKAWSTFNSGEYLKHMSVDTGVRGDVQIPGADALHQIAAGVHDMVRGGAWLANPHNWVRVLQVAAGAGLVIGALLILAKPVLEPAAAAAAKVATKGAV